MASEEARNLGGRPSIFTPELGEEICRRLGEGESLRNICSRPEMPTARTVNNWLSAAAGKPALEAFRENYMAAREVQQHLYVDRALAIGEGREAPDLDPDDFDDPRAYRVKVNENVQRDRLIVDTLQWSAERLLPKVYGRHARHEHELGLAGPATLSWREGPSVIEYRVHLGKKPEAEEAAS